jgi:hypothetical protein
MMITRWVRRLVTPVMIVLAWTLLAACGSSPSGTGSGSGVASPTIGDIPGDQAFVTYASPVGNYTIKVPEGWASTTDAAGVSFTDRLNTIRLESSTATSAPTTASAQADLATIKAGATGFVGGEVSTVTLPAGPALLMTYRADAPADPVTGKIINDDIERYQFFRGQTLLTVTLSGPHGADNVDPWRVVTDSLMWTE